jgi:hypothetical protein
VGSVVAFFVLGQGRALLTGRARARFDAATLIRRYAMELRGTEGALDYRANGVRIPYGFADTDPMRRWLDRDKRTRRRHIRRLARQWIWSVDLGVVLVLCAAALFVGVRRRHASPRGA